MFNNYSFRIPEKIGLNAEWIDIRGNLITDDRFRDADILWNESSARIRNVFNFKGTK